MAKFIGFTDGPPEDAYESMRHGSADRRNDPPGSVPPHMSAAGPGNASPQGGSTVSRRGKWLLIGAGVLVALAVVYAIASPFITVYRMKAAAERHDGRTLSSLIDFPSLRQNLKDQFDKTLAAQAANQDTQDNPFSAFGTALAGTFADNLVDTFVTPEGVERLMSGEPLTADSTSRTNDTTDPFPDASMSYESFNRFVVTIKDDDGKDVRFVYRPTGLTWKLSGIEMES